MKIGIVGHEAKKFTSHTEAMAKEIITQILTKDWLPNRTTEMISGHCHLGGIDIWAEEIAQSMGMPMTIFAPKTQNWSNGYKPRNIQIAETADVVHNIVVAKYPPDYDDMRFERDGLPYCYHCNTSAHVKSGGCWTARYAQDLFKPAHWHVLEI